jgi:hypothetical protein
MPAGFLKRTPRGWLRLDRDVRLLVVELARTQEFKCAFCSETRGLIVEHDHWPQRGMNGAVAAIPGRPISPK